MPQVLLVFLLLLPILLEAPPANADDDGPFYVQLPPQMAPTRPPGSKSTRMLPIRVVLEVTTEETSRQLCRLAHRVRDGINTELHARPVPLRKNGRMILSKVHSRLQKAVNRSLGRKLVSRAFVFAGDRDRATGGIRLPGIQRCQRIQFDRTPKKKKGR